MKRAVPLLLVALCAAVFWQVKDFGFVNIDDPRYVSDNTQVRAGVTWDGLRWAFTTFHTGNWHPLTWVSHMLDVQLFGDGPAPQHLVNAALHALNAALLFAVLRAITGATFRSALVAALFAVHPLHVESVAWISERKDVLSGTFALLALAAYARYAARPSRRRMLAVAALFALGLLAKPMLVTLPLVLLLLDGWPLRREGFLWREKLPLFALSLGSAIVTLEAQASGGAISGLRSIPLGSRLANAVLAAAAYLWKAVWPSSLAVLYPHPALTAGGIPPAQLVAAAATLLALAAVAVWQWKERPFVGVGLLWFAVMLLPVIGLVQVGVQSMADRYTYLPLVGVFIAVAWALPEPTAAAGRTGLAAACSASVLALAVVAHRQSATWRDSFTLFRHAISVTDGNGPAFRNLGVAYYEKRQLPEAIEALRESVRLAPWDGYGQMNLAIALSAAGAHAEAADRFRSALRMRPADAYLWFNYGISCAIRNDEAGVVEARARLDELNPELARRFAVRLGLQ